MRKKYQDLILYPCFISTKKNLSFLFSGQFFLYNKMAEKCNPHKVLEAELCLLPLKSPLVKIKENILILICALGK